MSNIAIIHYGPIDPTAFSAQVHLIRHVNRWGPVDEYALWSPTAIIGKLSIERGAKCPVTEGESYVFSRYKKGGQVMVKLVGHNKPEKSNGGN